MLSFLVAAADPGSQVGKNLGGMLQGLAVPVYLGVIGLFALAYLAGRQMSKLAVFAAAALGVGILVMDPSSFGDIAKSVGNAISHGI